MRKLRFVGVASALFVVLATTAIAPAAEAPTRAEYVTRLEGICKPGAETLTRTMDGVREDLKSRRDAVAAGKFEQAERIFGGTVRAISAVPRPSRDLATVSKWLGYLQQQQTYLKEIASRLRAGETVKAQHLTASFIRSGSKANNVSLVFGFNYCRFRFSRFN